MANSLSWGIIGTGAIAHTLANGLAKSRTGKLTAVASRSADKAAAFGQEFKLESTRCYGSYEALLADGSVQAIYIAIPHPGHARWAIAAMNAGKHVLVEKPIAVNQYDAEAIIEAALANKVLLIEAFMYRCHPATAKLVELLKERVIGDVRLIQAAFGFHAGFNADSRLFNNDQAGGGILDVGCYPMSIVRLIAGAASGQAFLNPIEVKGVGHLGQTGIDEWAAASLRFTGDIVAQISTSVAVNQDNSVRIFGSEGSIHVSNPWLANRSQPDTGTIIVRRNGEKEPREIAVAAAVTSFTLEADVFGDAVAAGKTQASSPAMSWDDSIGNIRALDAWRSSIGLTYDQEKPEGFRKTTVAGEPLRRRDKNRMKYGSIPLLNKKLSRLVMGVDNQNTLPHAAAIFDEFISQGGNVFDTAFIYGGGRHEQMLGHWIKNRGVRDEVAIIVKGAHPPDCNPEGITRQLKISLNRLQTDHADLYLMHRDNPAIPVSEFVDVLNEHVRGGRIKIFGGSNWSLQRVEEANEYARRKGLQPFSIVSNNFSLARMVAAVWDNCISASDVESRSWLKRTQVPLLAWSSQARGFFTERAHLDQKLNDEEMNRCWYSQDNWQRRERVVEMAKNKGVLPINIALAYVLCQPFPTFPLIGPRTLSELRTSLPGLDIALNEQELKWLNLEA